MRLQERTDYGLRMLMFLAADPAKKVPVHTVAEAYGISEAHLAKVVHTLAAAGFVETTAGRSGGVRLARPADQIRVGDVVRALERVELVECFREDGACPAAGGCGLQHALAAAGDAFFRSLDGVTIADVLPRSFLARRKVSGTS